LPDLCIARYYISIYLTVDGGVSLIVARTALEIIRLQEELYYVSLDHDI
jgi:hypothetical protein